MVAPVAAAFAAKSASPLGMVPDVDDGTAVAMQVEVPVDHGSPAGPELGTHSARLCEGAGLQWPHSDGRLCRSPLQLPPGHHLQLPDYLLGGHRPSMAARLQSVPILAINLSTSLTPRGHQLSPVSVCVLAGH